MKIAVLIGPEGGIDDEEINNIRSSTSNIEIVTLGKRILRTETAPIVISSNILYELEEIQVSEKSKRELKRKEKIKEENIKKLDE